MTVEDKLKASVLIVDANPYEAGCLWDALHMRCRWASNSAGIGITIGYLDSRPIVVSLTWATINDRMVTFVDACSEVVDWNRIHRWIRSFTNAPIVDAMNAGAAIMNLEACHADFH